MQGISEGCILLAGLVGELRRTELEGVYRFEHRLMAPTSTLRTYRNYLTARLQRAPGWPSSAGCAFEPVGEITPLEGGGGFGVLVRARSVAGERSLRS